MVDTNRTETDATRRNPHDEYQDLVVAAYRSGRNDLDDWFESLRKKFLTAHPSDPDYDPKYRRWRWNPLKDRQTATEEEVIDSWQTLIDHYWGNPSENELDEVTRCLAITGSPTTDHDAEAAYDEGFCYGRLAERYELQGDVSRFMLLAHRDGDTVVMNVHDAKEGYRVDVDVWFSIHDGRPTLEEYQQADPTIKTASAGHDLSL